MSVFDSFRRKVYHVLRVSERYTKTDVAYLARGGSWLTLSQGVSSLASFLLALAFANLLSPEVFGIYRYVLSVAGILAITTLDGINTSLVQAVARGHEGSTYDGLKTRLRWGLLGGVASLGVAGYYFLAGNSTLTLSFLIAAVFLPFMDSFGTYGAVLQGKKDFGKASRFNIINHLAAAGALFIALVLTSNPVILVLTYFASWTIARFVSLRVTLKRYPPNNVRDPNVVPYGKHLSFMGVLGVVAGQIDKILLFQYIGAAELALYTFALAIPEQAKAVLKNVGVLALPRFSERSGNEIQRDLAKKTILLSIVTLVFIITYIILAPFIFRVFFPQYTDAIFLSQIFSLSLLTIVSILPVTALQSQTKTRALYILNTATPIIQIVLLIAFIFFFGVLGAVIARVITRMFNTIIAYGLVNKL